MDAATMVGTIPYPLTDAERSEAVALTTRMLELRDEDDINMMEVFRLVRQK